MISYDFSRLPYDYFTLLPPYSIFKSSSLVANWSHPFYPKSDLLSPAIPVSVASPHHHPWPLLLSWFLKFPQVQDVQSESFHFSLFSATWGYKAAICKERGCFYKESLHAGAWYQTFSLKQDRKEMFSVCTVPPIIFWYISSYWLTLCLFPKSQDKDTPLYMSKQRQE